jgi:hypothetical protein
MVVLFFAAYVKPSTYPDDQSSNSAQCLTKKTEFLSHRRSNGVLLIPSLGAFSAWCVTIRHLYVRNVSVWHRHAIPQKDVTAVNPHSAQYVRWTRCVKRCANIAVDVFGVIPLVFRLICISRALVNVASSVRAHVTIRGTPSGSSWNDWRGFRWMFAGHLRTGGRTSTETSEQNVPRTAYEARDLSCESNSS